MLISFISYTFEDAMESFKDLQIKETLKYQEIYIFGTLYTIFVISSLLKKRGKWALNTYTINSWNLLTLTYIFSALGIYFPFFLKLREILIFPALIQATITIFLWWTAVVPGVLFHLSDNKPKMIAFLKFNSNFFLLNVHLFNFPIMLLAFILNAREILFFDLWISIVIAFVYVCSYLFELDRKGVHLYIFLTPRSHFCVLTYTGIFMIYYFIWY